MCMGVATANSVLVISFARERLAEIGDPIKAALEAGFVRFRPVLMTALAMMIGMAPMALGLGEGGEQNAPLGRAVIGGLFSLPSLPYSLYPSCSVSCIATTVKTNTESLIMRRKTTIATLFLPKENLMSEQSPQGIPQISSKKLGVVGAGAGIVLALVVAIGLVSRASSSTQLKDWTEAQTIPTVSITVPTDSQSKATLDLPGQLSAYSQAQIYARASGYLKS